jgi:hypothetical protein
MDETPRRNEHDDQPNRNASGLRESDPRDELAQRRSQSKERPALTRREREERWPIG